MDIRIVILKFGWVFVGRFTRDGQQCRLSHANNVKQWGTSLGLGELASEGPRKNTVLHPVPDVLFDAESMIASIVCEPKKWSKA